MPAMSGFFFASGKTMAYNTGNPVEPSGSSDPRDLRDNAQIIDKLVNSSDLTWLGRLGNTLKTWAGMTAEHNAAQVQRNAEFQQFLLSSGYEVPVPYAPGISITRTTQTVVYNGELYRPKQASLPFITTTFPADSAKWIANGDNSFRQELGSKVGDGGTSLTGYRGRLLSDKLHESVSIADAGGIDDGVFDNAAAFIAAKALIAPGGIIRFPRQRANSNYLFYGSPDFSNLVLDVDEGVILSGAFYQSPNIKVRRSTILQNTTLNYPYDLSAQFRKPLADRTMFMSDADKDISSMYALDTANDLISLSTDYLTGDAWTASAAVAQADGSFWSQTNTSKLYASLTSICRPGDELSCSFSTGGAYTRVAIIRTTAGYHMVACGAGNAQPTLTSKTIGNTAVTNSFSFTGQGVYQSYYGENSNWSIRIYDHQSFSVLWSGQEITGRLLMAQSSRSDLDGFQVALHRSLFKDLPGQET